MPAQIKPFILMWQVGEKVNYFQEKQTGWKRCPAHLHPHTIIKWMAHSYATLSYSRVLIVTSPDLFGPVRMTGLSKWFRQLSSSHPHTLDSTVQWGQSVCDDGTGKKGWVSIVFFITRLRFERVNSTELQTWSWKLNQSCIFLFIFFKNSLWLHAHEPKHSISQNDTKRTFHRDLFTEEVFYEIKSRNRWWRTSKWPSGASHSTQSTKSTIWLSSFQQKLRRVWRF